MARRWTAARAVALAFTTLATMLFVAADAWSAAGALFVGAAAVLLAASDARRQRAPQAAHR